MLIQFGPVILRPSLPTIGWADTRYHPIVPTTRTAATITLRSVRVGCRSSFTVGHLHPSSDARSSELSSSSSSDVTVLASCTVRVDRRPRIDRLLAPRVRFAIQAASFRLRASGFGLQASGFGLWASGGDFRSSAR